jgi:hypothetical protein
MKKIILSALLFLGVHAFAQNNNTIVPVPPIEQSKLSIGFMGGYGHSFIMPYQNYTFNSSWEAGLSSTYSNWAHWALGFDITYSSEGSSLKVSDQTYKTQLDYIRVPMRAIYFFKDYEDDFRPKITLGPTLGFLVNEVNSTGASAFDLGGSVSLGFNYRLMRAVWLTADVNYYQGFLDVYSDNSLNDMNGNARINLGLSFGF